MLFVGSRGEISFHRKDRSSLSSLGAVGSRAAYNRLNRYLLGGRKDLIIGTPRTDAPRVQGRKQQILESAAEMFAHRGFTNVTMNDIASSVGITAGALYRHYPNKTALLDLTVSHALGSLPEFDRSISLEENLAGLCRAAVTLRSSSGILTRQIQYLPKAAQEVYREKVAARRSASADLIVGHRRSLSGDQALVLAAAIQSVLLSPATNSTALDAGKYAALLQGACIALCETELIAEPSRCGREQPTLAPASRREVLLLHAIRLFAADGIEVTSMEQIGAAAGVTGPSLYTHFRNKDDIVQSASDRASQALWLDLHEALHRSNDAREALHDVVGAYVRRTHGWLNLSVLLAQVEFGGNEAAKTRQREYVEEWVRLIRQCRAELDESAARVLAHAAFAMINGIADRAGPPSTVNLPTMALNILGCL